TKWAGNGRRRSLLSKLFETIAKSNRSRNDLMLESYVLDSSVLVASLIPSDKYYSSGIMVVKRLLGSNDIVYASAIVPVEVCAAVSRRTKDKVSAREAAAQIEIAGTTQAVAAVRDTRFGM
ncbi:MAG: hypothetical protein P4L86_05520, partial [Mycobacterium sp.]|nr:hypothetical protein [Mycobacterium sp.]